MALPQRSTRQGLFEGSFSVYLCECGKTPFICTSILWQSHAHTNFGAICTQQTHKHGLFCTWISIDVRSCCSNLRFIFCVFLPFIHRLRSNYVCVWVYRRFIYTSSVTRRNANLLYVDDDIQPNGEFRLVFRPQTKWKTLERKWRRWFSQLSQTLFRALHVADLIF